MDDAAVQALARKLDEAGVDIAAITALGGGIWCFGSRAASCAHAKSDWDVLVVSRTPVRARRIRIARIDLVHVRLDEFDAWASTELAAHAAAYGVRIDRGREFALRSVPTAAAPRKCTVVSGRARLLDALWTGLQPVQQHRETLRLRRDLHRAWLLVQSAAIPPTALLESEWQQSAASARAAIINVVTLPRRIRRAISQLDG